MKFISDSPAQTLGIAREFGKKLRSGDIVAFIGGLGAGKTTFVTGCAEALGFYGKVTSPSYALVHEYHIKKTDNLVIFHFDMYRVSGYDDLCSTGFFDCLDSEAILFIEWSENIAQELPANTIFVKITNIGDNLREIKIESK
jgi:tRNA threonylcarbamoyladenosine biosynthesis protein TsaE